MLYLENLNSGLHEVFSKNEKTYLLGEDLLDPYGGAFKVSKGLSSKYPDRVKTTPISEAGFVGLACGMALRGLNPIVEIMFGDFVMLASDQIINHITKYGLMYGEHLDVPIVIRAPMGGGRGYGPTHSQNLEKHFLGIPNLQVVYPSELTSPGRTLQQSIDFRNPVLFIEGKTLYPKKVITQQDFEESPDYTRSDFSHSTIGSIVNLSNGRGDIEDITVISYGSMYSEIKSAMDQALMEEEILTDYFHLENLSHPDIIQLKDSIQKTGKVLIIDEGIEDFGIGSMLGSKLQFDFFKYLKAPVHIFGAKNTIIPSSKDLEKQVIVTSSDIYQSMINLFQYA